MLFGRLHCLTPVFCLLLQWRSRISLLNRVAAADHLAFLQAITKHLLLSVLDLSQVLKVDPNQEIVKRLCDLLEIHELLRLLKTLTESRDQLSVRLLDLALCHKTQTTHCDTQL